MRFGSLRKKDKPSAVSFEEEKNGENNGNDDGTEMTSPNKTKNNTNSNNDANRPPPTTNEVLDTVIEVRADAIQALKRTEGTLKLAEESGHESVKTLRTNDETLKRAERVADEMEMRSLNREIVTIGRRLSRDKCFLCLAVLVFIGVAIAIILPQVKPFFGPKEVGSNPQNYTSGANASTNSTNAIEALFDSQG